MTENNENVEAVEGDAAPQSEPEETEKRKGFHPALVISTIVVVLFVLWFCPRAMMRARVAQNEEAALSVLTDSSEKFRLLNMKPEKIRQLLKEKKYKDNLTDLKLVGLNFIGAKRVTKQNNIAVCLTPKYYGRTADRTFYLINGKVYAKDLGAQHSVNDIPAPGKDWEAIAVVK